MTTRQHAQQARHLSDDIDRLTRGEESRAETTDPEHQELLAAAALLDRELRGLRAARPGYRAALEARLLAQLPTVRRRWWQRFAIPTRPALSRAVVGVAVLVIVIAVAGTAATASSRIRVYQPGGSRVPLWTPLLPPPGVVAYQSVDPAAAARESGRALAYLPQPPSDLSDRIEVGILPTPPSTFSDELAMRIHALVRYQGGGHTVLVVLDEPSAMLAGQRDIVLGERAIRLADGREAWTSTHPNRPQGNVVAWVSEGYIVIVASDLPPETVATLAGQVIVAPAAEGAPSGATRWDTPPAASSPTVAPTGPADLAISGQVRQGGQGNRPDLTYQVSLGNRGGGTAEDVRVAIEPSSVLVAHIIDPDPPRTFGPQGPGQLSGLGGTITFDVAGLDPTVVRAALAEGITLRITWTEDGKPQERTFAIR